MVILMYDTVKSIQMQGFFWSILPVFRLNTGKYGPEKTPYFSNFQAG